MRLRRGALWFLLCLILAAAAALPGPGALPVPAGVVVPVTACLPKHGGAPELLLVLLPPQPAAARLASTARDIPAAAYPALVMAALLDREPARLDRSGTGVQEK